MNKTSRKTKEHLSLMTKEEYIKTWKVGDLLSRKIDGKLKFYIVLDKRITKNNKISLKMYSINKQKFYHTWKTNNLDQFILADDWK